MKLFSVIGILVALNFSSLATANWYNLSREERKRTYGMCGQEGSIEERIKDCSTSPSESTRIGKVSGKAWKLVFNDEATPDMLWGEASAEEKSRVLISGTEIWLDVENDLFWSKPIFYEVIRRNKDFENKDTHHWETVFYWGTLKDAEEHCGSIKAANGITIPGVVFDVPTEKDFRLSYEADSGNTLPRYKINDHYWYKNLDSFGVVNDWRIGKEYESFRPIISNQSLSLPNKASGTEIGNANVRCVGKRVRN